MTDVPPPGYSTQNIGCYQRDIHAWHAANFGDNEETPPTIVALALSEEGSEVIEAMITTALMAMQLSTVLGRIARASVKDFNKIRGTHEEWMEELRKEVGDGFILLCEVASRYDFSLEDAIWERWSVIYRRNWRDDKIGHGMPDAG